MHYIAKFAFHTTSCNTSHYCVTLDDINALLYHHADNLQVDYNTLHCSAIICVWYYLLLKSFLIILQFHISCSILLLQINKTNVSLIRDATICYTSPFKTLTSKTLNHLELYQTFPTITRCSLTIWSHFVHVLYFHCMTFPPLRLSRPIRFLLQYPT